MQTRHRRDHHSGPRAHDPCTLARAAQDAWAEEATGRQWTVWARLTFGYAVTEDRAMEMAERWARRLRERVPGAAVLVGIHTDTLTVHAHALVFVPRRVASPHLPPRVRPVAEAWGPWLASVGTWRHGSVWAERFDASRADGARGAARYLTRCGAHLVSRFGTAPGVTRNLG